MNGDRRYDLVVIGTGTAKSQVRASGRRDGRALVHWKDLCCDPRIYAHVPTLRHEES